MPNFTKVLYLLNGRHHANSELDFHVLLKAKKVCGGKQTISEQKQVLLTLNPELPAMLAQPLQKAVEKKIPKPQKFAIAVNLVDHYSEFN